jgi:hypothetical protein
VIITLRVGLETGSWLAAFGAFAGLCVLIAGLIWWGRRRTELQLEAFRRTGEFSIDAGLDFACLPGDWPSLARDTLNPAGADRVVSLPVELHIDGDKLAIVKKRSWGSGRAPFEARVALSEVSDVVVGRSERAYAGSSLCVELVSGDELRLDLSADDETAEQITDALKRRVRSASPAMRVQGLVVTSQLPPVRTSSGRAGLLLMAPMAPFAVAMAGAPNGPVADAATFLVFCYAAWLMMRRLPTMHIHLGVALIVASGAFVIDAVTSSNPWRLVGTIVCLGLGFWILRLETPTRRASRSAIQ